MTTPQSRNRTPEGTPGGGQFASETGSRPSGSLTAPAAPPITAGLAEKLTAANKAFEVAREYDQRLTARLAAEHVTQVWPTATRVTLRQKDGDFGRFYIADDVFDADDVLLGSVESADRDFKMQSAVMGLDAETDRYTDWGYEYPDGSSDEEPYLDVTACLKLPLDEPANPEVDRLKAELAEERSTGLSFHRDAIREHFEVDGDGDPTVGFNDEDLDVVGARALADDELYSTFHRVLTEQTHRQREDKDRAAAQR
jgi:hypothetical protein